MEFDAFWKEWPRRRSKLAAQRAWRRMKKADRLAALEALPLHVAQWESERRGLQFIPYPATWLNGRSWEDEIEEAAPPAGPVRRQGYRADNRPARCSSRADTSSATATASRARRAGTAEMGLAGAPRSLSSRKGKGSG